MLNIFQNLFGNIFDLVIRVGITLIAITGHEFAHAWASTKLGDPTPRTEGRLSLNPFAHLDLIGTFLMVFTRFGWAKPVHFNPAYYKNGKKGTALVALAGPCANLIMSFIVLLLYYIYVFIMVKIGFGIPVLVTMIVKAFVVRNLCFMVFNLIPIPPLDGAKVLGIFLSNRAYYTMLQYERYSMILIMFLSLTGVFGNIIGTGVNFVFGALTGFFNSLFNLVV